MDEKFDLDEFSDIRPYNDEECLPVVKRLLDNNQLFFRLAKIAFPRITRISPTWGALISRWTIVNRLRNVKDIKSFQLVMMNWFFFRMLAKTTDGINHQWLDNPTPEDKLKQGNLLLSNHRDIAVDPAVVAHSLFMRNNPLPLVGIGDNLLSNPYVADVMKLNRGFIVQRTLESAKQMFFAMQKLSKFIHYSIGQKENVWLAQREGRAKDSRDRTSRAVIKMLKLHSGKEESWANALNPLNIRTVAISYQYDPCVIYKAKTLLEGNKKKKVGTDAADLDELVQGITGKKGMVNVVVSKNIVWQDDVSLDEVIVKLDAEIISNYKLYNSHFYCLKKLVGLGLEDEDKLTLAQEAFKPETTECKILEKSLTEKLGKEVYVTCLYIYANPILEKLSLMQDKENERRAK